MPHDPVAWVPDPFSQFARSRPVVCPINDLLWLHLSERDPNDAVGIIVQVRTSASAPSLAALLRPALGQGGIVVYGEYVLAAARFDHPDRLVALDEVGWFRVTCIRCGAASHCPPEPYWHDSRRAPAGRLER